MGCSSSSAEKDVVSDIRLDNSNSNSASAVLHHATGPNSPASPTSPKQSTRFRSSSAGSEGSERTLNAPAETLNELTELDRMVHHFSLPDPVIYIIRSADKKEKLKNNDLLNDAHNLYSKQHDNLSKYNAIYPVGNLSQSGILRISSDKESVSDKFLEMIEATYKNGRSSTGAGAINTVQYRIILILQNGTSRSLVFPNFAAYWGFIRALKNCKRNANTSYSVDCTLVKQGSSASSVAAKQQAERSSVVSFIGSKLRSVATPGSSSDSVDLHCSIATGTVSFSTASTSKEPPPSSFSIQELLAITLSSDFAAVRRTVVEVDFLSQDWNFSKAEGMKETLCIEAHYSARPAEVPVTFFNAGGRKYMFFCDSDFSSDETLQICVFAEPSANDERIEVGRYELSLKELSESLENIHSAPDFFEQKTLPTLIPYHVTTPPVPLVHTITLSVPEEKRMLKFVLHNIMDLLGGDGAQTVINPHKMKCFCVVELLAVDGTLLSPPNLFKTPELVNPGFDPVWETEFYFPIQVDNKDVDSIRIKVIDSSSMLRYYCIGQVSMPATVFGSVNDLSRLRLPIEAIGKDGEIVVDCNTFGCGIICVGTQTCPRNLSLLDKAFGGFTVSGNAAHSTTQALNNGTGNMDPAIVHRGLSQMTSAGSAVVALSVRELDVHGTCWPFRAVSGGITSLGFGRAANFLDQSGVVDSLGEGHLFAGLDHLVLLPNSDYDTTFVKLCVEWDHNSTALEPILRIPWSQISRFMDRITDSVVALTVTLHAAPKNSGYGSSNSSNSTRRPSSTQLTPRSSFVDVQSEIFEVDLIVAPCAAESLRSILFERFHLCKVRSMVKSFIIQSSKVTEARTTNKTSSGASNNSQLPRGLTVNTTPFSTAPETLTLAKTILGVIVASSFFSSDASCSNQGIISQDDFLDKSHFLAAKESVNLKLSMYASLLLDGIRVLRNELSGRNWWAIASPATMATKIKELILVDVAAATEAICNLPEDSAERITRKVEFISDSALDHIREVLLCCWGNDYPQHALLCVDTILQEVYSALRGLLNTYLNSPAAFEVVGGLESKTALFRFILSHNSYLSTAAINILSVFGLQSKYFSKQNPNLLNNATLEHLISMYSSCLVGETRSWLARSLAQYLKTKTNTFGLPWDIEKIGNKYMSALPETFRYQINIYLSLCWTENSDGENDFDIMTSGPMDSMHQEALLTMNTSIVNSILVSVLLLSDEFKLALKCKCWEDSCESNEATSRLHFLVALANDCYRISVVHMEAILAIPYHKNAHDANENAELARDIKLAFDDVIRICKTNIVRIIFADLGGVLLNFDSLWEQSHARVFESQSTASKSGNIFIKMPEDSVRQSVYQTPNSSPIETLILTARDYFSDLEVVLEFDIFRLIPTVCAEVCIIRYLLFLKELSDRIQSAGLIISPSELITTVEHDYLEMYKTYSLGTYDINLFDATTPNKENTQKTPEDKALFRIMISLERVLVLLKCTASDVKVLTLLRELSAEYGQNQDGIAVIESFIRMCSILKLGQPIKLIDPSSSSGVKETSESSSSDFLTVVMNHWTSSCGVIKRQSLGNHGVLHGNVDLKFDIYTKIFKSDDKHSVSSTNKSATTAIKMIRVTAANMNITPYDAHKKSKDTTKVSLLRKLGLLEPEHVVPGPSSEITKSKSEHSLHLDSPFHKKRPSKVLEITETADKNDQSLHYPSAGLPMSPLGRRPSKLLAGQTVDIVISQIEVRNLKTSSKIGDANPYVSVSIVGHPDIEPKKTEVKWNSETAAWTDVLIFELVDASKIRSAVLNVTVFDKERIRRKMLLGGVEIPLTGIDTRDISSWFSLEGGPNGSNGEIHLHITQRLTSS